MIFENKRTIDFREVRRLLWRRRFLIAIPPIITLAASGVGVFLAEPAYDSTATLMIETPVPLTRTVEAATGTRGRGTNYAIQTIRKKIQSTSFLESVAVQVGLHENPRLLERVEQLSAENPGHDPQDLLRRECVNTLYRMLEIQAEGADLFSIRAVSSSPDIAYRVSKTVAEQYIQSGRQSRLRQSEEAFRFSQDQMAIYEKKLEEKRSELRKYEQKMALKPFSASPVRPANVARVKALIATADSDIEYLNGRLAKARERLEEQGLQAFVNVGFSDSAKLSALQETLYELERHLAFSSVEYSESGRTAEAVRGQIAVRGQQLLTELESIAALTLPSLSDESRRLLVDFKYNEIGRTGVERRKRELNRFVREYAADLAEVPAKELRLSQLQEEVASAERLYQTWLEQANSTQIAKAVQSASVGNLIALIEPAKLPLSPFAPEKGRILVLALIMGVVLGFGGAVLTEYLDLTMKSVREIEAVLGVPILGAVPKMQAVVAAELGQRRQRRVRILVVSLLMTAVGLMAVGYYYFLLPPPGTG